MSLEFGRAELDDRLRAERHLRNESRRDETGRGSATESASTRASAKRDAEHRSGKLSLTDRDLLQGRELKRRSDLVAIWQTFFRTRCNRSASRRDMFWK